MELSHQEGMVLAALMENGGRMAPSSLRADYDFTTPGCCDQPQASAIINVDIGINGLIDRGLVDFARGAGDLKYLVLTEEAKRQLAE